MKRFLIISITTLALAGCTKLEERFNGQLSDEDAAALFGSGGGSAASLLQAAYDGMRNPYQDQSRWWAAQQHTTDETIGPTRAGDWDDNGVWRVLHSHQWDPNHGFLADTYRELGKVVFAVTDMLRFSPTPQQAAEGRLLRAMAMFSMLDGWDQVPYRENTADPYEIPKIRKGVEAADYIISELNAILGTLPVTPANRANRDGARALLMKVYLNKGVYANRAAPTFSPADMNQVITIADQLLGSTRNYALTPNYFDNFAPANDAIGTENIWTAENLGGVSSGNVRSRWFATLHYKQNPSGWNGFTTLSDFYDKFEAADKRRGQLPYPGHTQGVLPGFLIGQQKDGAGNNLTDRTGQPLAFTREVKLVEVGSNLEVTGIRVVKYPIDYASGDNSNNDYVYFRIADVLLMKAEAIMRGGTGTANPNPVNFGPGVTALAIVNWIRTHPSRGASALGAITLDQLLDERGRELYWEGWRRNDLIRFGKYLNAWQEKATSGPERLLFPIPSRSLAANPNMVQNPGY